MKSQTLSVQAMAVIDAYLHFTVGDASASVPYFNNKTAGTRLALRANRGKGSPEEIREEVDIIIAKNHIDTKSLTTDTLKKLLVDNNLGIDCSALAYYILDAEYAARGKSSLKSRLSFVNRPGFLGKFMASIRAVENAGVTVFVHDKNSSIIPLREILPGDIITMIGGPDTNNRDHILIVETVEHDGSNSPTKINYVHTIAYPNDGLYGNGIRRGTITVADPSTSILTASWSESILLERARKSKTEIRRLR